MIARLRLKKERLCGYTVFLSYMVLTCMFRAYDDTN